MIASIDTYYNGNYFRSRLEARWAIYFEQIGIRYQYEKEGYTFNGLYYLPDFFFPDFDFFGEVKYEGFGNADAERWEQFTNEIKKPLLIFEGSPNAKPCRAFGIFDCELKIIPFSHLLKQRYGLFWHSGGEENFSRYEPFKSAILTANKKRFEHKNK